MHLSERKANLVQHTPDQRVEARRDQPCHARECEDEHGKLGQLGQDHAQTTRVHGEVAGRHPLHLAAGLDVKGDLRGRGRGCEQSGVR